MYLQRDQAEALIGLATALDQDRQNEWASHAWQEAELTLKQGEQTASQAEALRKLVKALLVVCRRREAEQIAGSISVAHSRAWALSGLALALAKAQQWQESERIIRSING